MKLTLRGTTVLVGTALLVLSLAGCITTNESSSPDGKIMDPHSNHSMPITDKQSFAEAMIPHHQQALDMSELAATNTTNPEVLAIADKIISEQGTEIEKLTPWLNGRSVDYTMMMDGMVSQMELNTLRGVRNQDFDKLFAQYMIEHHEGAISMATQVLSVDDQELADFASQIIEVQTTEIELLRVIANG